MVRCVKLSYELEETWKGLVWIVYLQVSSSQSVFDRLILTKQCRCFDEHTQGADGAADLFEVLSQSTQLENLDLQYGSQIPAAAWQKLHGANWPNLKKANFCECLAERNWRSFSCFFFSAFLPYFVSVGSCSSLEE